MIAYPLCQRAAGEARLIVTMISLYRMIAIIYINLRPINPLHSRMIWYHDLTM
jgi:hypothetical protein